MSSLRFIAEISGRLDSVLCKATGETRSFVAQQVLLGAVCVNGQSTKKNAHRIKVGDEITARWIPTPAPAGAHPIAASLEILFEDADLLVINKPQGLVVHPAPSHSGETLVHHLLHHLENQQLFSDNDEERPGIVHRLDKGTSGVMVIAKNRSSQDNLSRQFKDREIKKRYEAVVWGNLPTRGRWDSAIGRDPINRRKMSSRSRAPRAALTDWISVRQYSHFTHVHLFPTTGRTHQLRVHLSEAGHPIVGDALYGRGLTPARRKQIGPTVAEFIERQPATFLHAAELKLNHPSSGKPLQFLAQRPEAFDVFLKMLEEKER